MIPAKSNTMLILEDELEQLVRYKEIAAKLSYEVIALPTLLEAKAHLGKEKAKRIDLILTDIHLSRERTCSAEGLEFISFLKENYSEILVLAMSNDPRVETYQKAMAAGAAHFLKKPIVDENELAVAIEMARGVSTIKKASQSLLKPAPLPPDLKELCPDGMVMSEAERNFAKKIAISKHIPVIILGETGSGKELFAQLIHRERCAREGIIPLVSVNCGNIDEQMAASLLFGHVKGAFTGAVTNNPGYIGEASGGILFLDEIHCLSKNLQQRLLRVLNDGTYERLGDQKKLKSQFQIICATTKNLYQEVKQGRFLLDLQTRLEGHNVKLRPLRDRKEDIPLLVSLFFAQERIKVSAVELNKIIQKCQSYYWQGNIRLLHRAIQALIGVTAMCGEEVKADQLPFYPSMMAPEEEDMDNFSTGVMSADFGGHGEMKRINRAFEEDLSFTESIELYEKMILQTALNRHKSFQDVCEALGLPRTTLHNKLMKYNLK